MTSAMDFLELRICRKRCDYSNDLENPLLEATSSTAKGEHEQEKSSKEDPSTPRPKRLMLTLFVSLFVETMAITIYNLISSQGRESIFLFHLGGVIGPIVDVIAVGIFVLWLVRYFRFVHADVKDKAFFGIFFTAGISLGLAMETLRLIVVSGVENNVKKSNCRIVGKEFFKLMREWNTIHRTFLTLTPLVGGMAWNSPVSLLLFFEVFRQESSAVVL
jgi:hypothetical protein